MDGLCSSEEEYRLKKLVLTKGKAALIDDADYERASQFKWQAVYKKGWYASRRPYIDGKQPKEILLHRYILDAPDEMQVDHIDGDGLNCTRANMRLCTLAENTRNRKRPVTNTSGYKGVSWHKLRGKWRAEIGVNGRNKHLGLFESKDAAALAYNGAALEHYGEFARLNLIGGV